MVSASNSRRKRSREAAAAHARSGSQASRLVNMEAALMGSSRGQKRASIPSSQSSEIGPMSAATMGRPAAIASIIASEDDSE